MKKSVFFVTFLFLLLSTAAFCDEGYINVDSANVRKGPSKKQKIVASLGMNEKITIVEKKGQWYKIEYKGNETGWISASLVRLIEKSTIKIDFLNINDKFKEYFKENLLFFDSQLKGYDLSSLKLIVSYSEKANAAMLTLILPFDKQYYDEKRTKEIGGAYIDFMVYNDYLWGLVKYKIHVAESVELVSMDDFQALMSFKSSIVLIKDNGDSIILSGKFSGCYVVFNPYIDVEFEGYEPVRVYSVDKEAVEDNSLFYLPGAKVSDGKLMAPALLYNFFDLPY